MDLVIEGDYFQILGVSRDATNYEFKRAYLDLRRAYEPSRLLTAATADLAEDLKVVLEIIEEAWEALRDAGRRERYRAALEARPPS
jgi:curved DNA-binding protein CbpA